MDQLQLHEHLVPDPSTLRAAFAAFPQAVAAIAAVVEGVPETLLVSTFAAGISLDCSIDNEVAAGDHTVVILDIDGLSRVAKLDPPVFHRSRFRRLQRGSIKSSRISARVFCGRRLSGRAWCVSTGAFREAE